MKARTPPYPFIGLALAGILLATTGNVGAQGPPQNNESRHDRDDNRGNQGRPDDRGQQNYGNRGSGQQGNPGGGRENYGNRGGGQQNYDNRGSGQQNYGNAGGPGRLGGYHFGNDDRNRFAPRYRSDAMRWRNRNDRPRFYAGYTIPRNYAIRPVPQSYWAGGPPPPPGYQYGYYDGYVVAYNPATRLVADVLDLVAGGF